MFLCRCQMQLLASVSFLPTELRKRRRRKKQRMLQARRRRIVRDVSSQNDFLANALQSNSLKAYAEERQSQCKMRLYDECSTPNCNLRCPTYMSLFSSDSNTNNRASNSFNSNARIQYNTDFSDIENSIDNPVELAEVISRQRWLAQATCKQLFHAFYYGSLGNYIGLDQ